MLKKMESRWGKGREDKTQGLKNNRDPGGKGTSDVRGVVSATRGKALTWPVDAIGRQRKLEEETAGQKGGGMKNTSYETGGPPPGINESLQNTTREKGEMGTPTEERVKKNEKGDTADEKGASERSESLPRRSLTRRRKGG